MPVLRGLFTNPVVTLVLSDFSMAIKLVLVEHKIDSEQQIAGNDPLKAKDYEDEILIAVLAANFDKQPFGRSVISICSHK